MKLTESNLKTLVENSVRRVLKEYRQESFSSNSNGFKRYHSLNDFEIEIYGSDDPIIEKYIIDQIGHPLKYKGTEFSVRYEAELRIELNSGEVESAMVTGWATPNVYIRGGGPSDPAEYKECIKAFETLNQELRDPSKQSEIVKGINLALSEKNLLKSINLEKIQKEVEKGWRNFGNALNWE